MIIDIPDTSTSAINRRLVDLRESGGAIALGRVLTLVISAEETGAEDAIRAANDASREHPCRVIAVVRANKRGISRLDAQIRIGGDAGASEVIVLRLYGPLADHGESVITPLLLPDAPIVAWWPGGGPDSPVEDRIGAIAHRRITDSSVSKNPMKTLQARAKGYTPGDTDLAWTRVTLWRALLAAALDEPPYEVVTGAVVTGGSDSPSTDLLAAWLTKTLRCPVQRVRGPVGVGVISVVLQRHSGEIMISRPSGKVATMTQPGQPDRHVSLPARTDQQCLAEELRRLDPDEIYAEVLIDGMEALAKAATAAKPKGDAKTESKNGLKGDPRVSSQEAVVPA